LYIGGWTRALSIRSHVLRTLVEIAEICGSGDDGAHGADIKTEEGATNHSYGGNNILLEGVSKNNSLWQIGCEIRTTLPTVYILSVGRQSSKASNFLEWGSEVDSGSLLKVEEILKVDCGVCLGFIWEHCIGIRPENQQEASTCGPQVFRRDQQSTIIRTHHTTGTSSSA
jgi:hypothetical protein